MQQNNHPSGQVSIPQALEIARNHASEGRLDEAGELCRKILGAEPNNLQALHMLAIVTEQTGDNPKAVKLFKKALKIDPGFADARYNLGNLYLRSRQHKKAETCYRAVVEQAPGFAPAHNNLGLALMNTGQLQEAETCFTQALELEPEAPHTLNNLGNLYGDTLRPEEAEKCYRRAIEILPDYVDAHVNLGKLYRDADRFEEAEERFRKALGIAPENADAHNNLAIVLRETGRLEEAAVCVKEAIRLDPDPAYPHYVLGKIMEQSGQQEPAIEAYRSCLERDGADPFGAGLSLAHLGAAPIPEEAPLGYLDLRYAKKAGAWDQSVEGDTPYRGPELVLDMLGRLCPDWGGRDILDAGCGTGLIGVALQGKGGTLTGVDLSAPMLEKARDKQVYDSLHEGDLVQFLRKNTGAYDIILSAATLIYFGDLEPVFAAIEGALRPGGCFIFTAFPSLTGDISVTAFSCYAHSEDYIRSTAAKAGLNVELLETDIHEYKEGEPVSGLVVGLNRLGDIV